MLAVDLHCHTLFSKCGIHTHMELLTRAKELGLKGLAITDHGPVLEPSTPGPFWDRLNNPLDGIKMFKGMECNVLDEEGNIDLPEEKLKYMDIVLLGLHPNLTPSNDKFKNTNMLIKAMEKNKAINVITHPNDKHYPVNFYRLAILSEVPKRSSNSSPTAASDIPHGLRIRRLITTPSASPESRWRKGRTCSSSIGSISAGTPGRLATQQPSTSTRNPGAPPCRCE